MASKLLSAFGPGFIPGKVTAIKDVVQRTFKHRASKVPATLVVEDNEHHQPVAEGIGEDARAPE